MRSSVLVALAATTVSGLHPNIVLTSHVRPLIHHRHSSTGVRCGVSEDGTPAFDELSRNLARYNTPGLRLRTSGPVRYVTDFFDRLVGGVSGSGRAAGRAAGALPVHGAAALLTAFAYAAQSYAPRAAMAGGARVNALIDSGQWHRLVSPVLLHGSFMHLLSNLFSLWRIGPLVQTSFGPARMWLLYLSSGITGNLAGLAWGPARGMSVGASGAVFGMIGATGGYVLRNRRALGSYGDALLSNAGQILLLNLFIGTRRGSGVDNLAHVGGFACGALVGLLVAPEAGRREGEGDGALLPPWCVRGLLAAMVVLYLAGLGQATRIALTLMRVYGRM